MSNVLAFPLQPSAIKAKALEHVAQQMRINFAIGCTAAQGIPTQDDLCSVMDSLTAIATLVDDYMGILRACE